MEEAENVFTESELESLMALQEGGNTHDFALTIFRKVREKSNFPDLTDEFFENNILPQIEETLDNPVISFLPSEQLISIVYMAIELSLQDGESADE